MENEGKTKPSRNLALELVRVTEAAAMAAGRYFGRGEKLAADGAAVDAMRLLMNEIEMYGKVVIGEGEKDEAPMLFNGEFVGNGEPPALDIAVDPVEGTTLVAKGMPNAIATVAASPRGTMFDPGPMFYMNKIAVGPEARDVIDINAPIRDNLDKIAKAKNMPVGELTVVILDRPRHATLIQEVRDCGARIRLIPAGDVAGALMAAWSGTGIDVLLGIGGTPEAVLAACGLRAMRGGFQGKLWPRHEADIILGEKAGCDFDRVLTLDDLVRSDDTFFVATGISDGPLLDGVSYSEGYAHTHSLVARGLTCTVRE
ncbi:MAG: class II fructose-bisphosphatase, partial [Anaerolineales bacterium]